MIQNNQTSEVQQPQQGSPQQQPSQNNSNVLRYWDVNDHNEIYLIKTESLKKSYDNIVKKLQKERVKFLKKTQNIGINIQEEEITFLPRQIEQQIEQESKNLREQFSFVKDMFWKKFQTKQILNQKQQKLKRNVDQIQEEIKLENIRELKDSDIASFYHQERNKLAQQFAQRKQ